MRSLSPYVDQINADCRDAYCCARNLLCTHSAYWERETRVYTLATVGTDPFGFEGQGAATI